MRIPTRSIATLLMAVGVATCSDGPTGPLRNTGVTPDNGSGPVIGRGRLSLLPVFSKSAENVAAHLADFGIEYNQVRVVIVRPVSDTVKDTTVTFVPGQSDLTLNLIVDVKAAGEVFTGAMDYKSPSGVVFHGEAKVQAHAPDQPAPPQTQLVLNYVGPGSNATNLTVLPKTAPVTAPGSVGFSFLATDASGNAVPGVLVNWSTSDASVATISSTGVLVATGKRGSVTVTAITPTNLSDNAIATITLPAAGMALVSGGGQTGRVGTSLSASAVVRVAAADGVGVPGVSVNFAAPAGGAVGSSSVTTDANGTAATSLKLGTLAGPQSFAAAAGAFSAAIPAIALPDDPAAIVAVSGGGQVDTVRHALKAPLIAKVTDQFSNAVPNVAVSWSKSGAGALGAASSTTNADGLASVGYTLGPTVGGETITASAAGAGVSFAVQALAAAPTTIAAVSGADQTGRVGEPLAASLVARVTDDAGNAVKDAPVTWTTTTGTLGSGATTSDAQGLASNSLVAGRTIGPASITASIPNGRSTSFVVAVIAGIPTKIAFKTMPANTAAATAIAPAVQVVLQDIGDNVSAASIAPVTLAIGANPGGAKLTGTLTRNAVGGIATFDDLKLDKAGAGYTLTASSTILPVITSSLFSVGAGSATGIQILAGGAQTGVVNTAAPAAPSVQLLDANKNPIVGALVTFTPAVGSGAVLPTSPVPTDAQGIATLSSWTFGTVAGPQSMTVSALGLTSVTIGATATAGPATKLGITTQPSATATTGVALAQQPVIQVQDQFGNAASTGTMTISATPSSGTATGTATVNQTTGVAAFTNLTVTGSGNITVEFSSSNPAITHVTSTSIALSQGTATTMTVLAADGVTVIPTSQTITVNLTAGVLPTSSPQVKITDEHGQPVSGVPVTLTATGASPFAATLTTGALGTVGLAGTLRVSGTYNVTASTNPALSGSPRTATIVVATAPAEQLRFVSVPTSAQAGSSTSAGVAVTDSLGNLVPGGTDPLTLAIVSGPTGGTLTGGTATVVSSTGLASFTSLLFSAAGTYVVSASSSAHPGYRSVNGTIVVGAAGSFANLIISNAPTSLQNNAVIPDMTVRLANGSTVVERAGIVITATMTGTSSPALLVGTNTVIQATTDQFGAATFSGMRAVGTVQTIALNFAASGTAISVNSANISLGVGVARHIAVTAGNNQTGLVGVSLPTGLRVQLTDTLNQSTATSPATTIAYSVVTGGGSVTSTAGTNVSGYTDATWTLGTEGSNTVQAQATVNGSTQSVTFTATAADAHSMSFSATPSASQTNALALSPQPTIQMLDASSNAVKKAGVVVTATVAPAPEVTGATFAMSGTTTATTDANGLATFTTLAVTGTSGLVARLRFTVTSATANTIAALTKDITLGAGAATTADALSALAVRANVGDTLTNSTYPSVRVRDASNNIVANAANTSVTFTNTSGSCVVSGQPVSIDVNGVAALRSTTLTMPPSAGSCVIHAVTSPALTGSPFDFRVVAAPSGAVVWSGVTDDDFTSSSNWIGGTAPTSSSAVFVPRFMLRSPKMHGDATVASFTMETGGTFDVGTSNRLTVTGTVDAATVTNGTVAAVGAASNIKGSFAALTLGDGTPRSCRYTLTGTVSTTSNVQISSCGADVSNQTLTINGTLSVTGTASEGRLSMHSASGKVTVAGAATFSGAATDTSLTAGTLEIAGNFTQSNTASVKSFAASGSHITKLTGTAAQDVTFASSTNSHFQDLNVTNASGAVTIKSIVDVKNAFTMGSGAKLAGTFSGGGTRLIVDGTVTAASTSDLGGLDSLQYTGSGFPAYANTTAGKAPKLTEISGSGSMTGNVTVGGGLGISGTLDVAGHTLTILDSLIVIGDLKMLTTSDVASVGGLVRFKGGTNTTHINAGTLKVGGDFIEDGSSASFSTPSGFLVQLDGTGSQSVFFSNPGRASARFANLEIDNTSANGVTFSSNLNITGNLEQKGRLAIPSGTIATVDGTSSFETLGGAFPGAVTVISGSLALGPADFYNSSSTTGSGTLTTGTCRYGSADFSGSNISKLSVGSTFNLISCTPGRGGSFSSLP
jgi:hypothetical protein